MEQSGGHIHLHHHEHTTEELEKLKDTRIRLECSDHDHPD
jgi:hypothetical protein